jgi:hypothetical protein
MNLFFFHDHAALHLYTSWPRASMVVGYDIKSRQISSVSCKGKKLARHGWWMVTHVVFVKKDWDLGPGAG